MKSCVYYLSFQFWSRTFLKEIVLIKQKWNRHEKSTLKLTQTDNPSRSIIYPWKSTAEVGMKRKRLSFPRVGVLSTQAAAGKALLLVEGRYAGPQGSDLGRFRMVYPCSTSFCKAMARQYKWTQIFVCSPNILCIYFKCMKKYQDAYAESPNRQDLVSQVYNAVKVTICIEQHHLLWAHRLKNILWTLWKCLVSQCNSPDSFTVLIFKVCFLIYSLLF